MIDNRYGIFRISTALLCVSLAVGCASLNSEALSDLLGVSGQRLDEATVADGLREALRIGTERSVQRTSRIGGFWERPEIRIPLPDRLERMAGALRKLGLDEQVDELEQGMNRAAELAAAEAIGVFSDAIRSMTLEDAFGILRGEPTAATEYFRARTEGSLRGKFNPIVQAKMSEIRLSRVYENLAGRYDQLPFVTRPAVDLDVYITENALDGLFKVLAEEEQRIRKDPAARTTELLRRVFRR